MREADAVARADLQHAPGQPRHQLVAPLADLALHQRAQAVEQPRKQRVADLVGYGLVRRNRVGHPKKATCIEKPRRGRGFPVAGL